MDGVSTTIVVILFVATIMGSFGSNQGFKQPTTKVPEAQKQVTTIVQNMPEIPNPNYYESPGKNIRLEIKNYIAKYRKNDEAESISSSIMMYAKVYGVNPKLVAALMARESRYNPSAISSSGAVGLGQLLPSTSKALGISNAYSIDQNAKGTTRYMKYLLDRFKKYPNNQVVFALGGYLEGPNAVERKLDCKPHTKAYVRDIIKIYHKI